MSREKVLAIELPPGTRVKIVECAEGKCASCDGTHNCGVYGVVLTIGKQVYVKPNGTMEEEILSGDTVIPIDSYLRFQKHKERLLQ